MREDGRLCLILLLIMVWCPSLTSGFSDGRKLSKDNIATRKLYCNRPIARRAPLHFHSDCNGYCEPRRDFHLFYNLNVSNTTYWLNVIRVNISAKPDSGKSVTGFSIYTLDASGHVAGSFVEDDTDVVVGTCNDVITITDETHAAFHKMANHSRKNISIQWQPDGYNHGKVRFVLWVVNNHTDIYFVESEWLTSQKHGGDVLNVVSSLGKVMSDVDMESFEKSFAYRSRKGYQLDLANPFSVFAKSPSKIELVPLDSDQSSKSFSMTQVTVSGNDSQTDLGGNFSVSRPGNSTANRSTDLKAADGVDVNNTIHNITLNPWMNSTENVFNNSMLENNVGTVNSSSTSGPYSGINNSGAINSSSITNNTAIVNTEIGVNDFKTTLNPQIFQENVTTVKTADDRENYTIAEYGLNFAAASVTAPTLGMTDLQPTTSANTDYNTVFSNIDPTTIASGSSSVTMT